MGKFIVIGSGVSGSTAGLDLAERGHQVEMIEKDSMFGGKILEYCCKATDSCSRCGVCVGHTQVYNSLMHGNVMAKSGITIESASNDGKKVTLQCRQKNPSIDYKKCNGCDACVEACPEGCITKYHRGELVQYAIDYSKCRLHRGEACDKCVAACAQGAITGKSDSAGVTFTADGVLVATGHDPFDAEQKPRYSYGQAKNVFTGTEAEDILSRSYYLTKKDERIAFIQCVGSRDPVIGRNYCSGVCCAYAMRMARIVKYRNPEAEVTIYYIDLQNFDKNFTQFKQELVDLGVRFVRGVPFKVEELASGKLKLLIENMGDDEDTIVEHDAVVLSVGLGAAADSPKIAEQFGLSRDEFGFFTTVKDNVFVSGTCKEPLTIPSSIAAAKATALEMGKYKHE